MVEKHLEVLVVGDCGEHQGLIDRLRDLLPSLDLEYTEALPSHYYTKDLVLLTFSVHEMDSFYLALALASDIEIPKVLVGFNNGGSRAVEADLAVKFSSEVSASYFELREDSMVVLFGLIIAECRDYLRAKTQGCVIRMSRKTMRTVQTAAMCLSVLCILEGLMLIITASIEFIQEYSSRPPQGVIDSLIACGMITFVISFIGYYGLSKAGIKEYFKAFYVTMVGVITAKLALWVLYVAYSYDQSSSGTVTFTVLTMAICLDLTTIVFTAIYNCAVTHRDSASRYSYDEKSVSMLANY